MTDPEDAIRVHHRHRILMFQVNGRGTMKHSAAVESFARRCLEQGCGWLAVDLRHCTYMDSTFMGTILALLKAAKRSGSCRLELVSPSTACRALLEQMGFDRLVPIAERRPEPDVTWTDLPTDADADDPDRIRRSVYEAHEQLARLPGRAGEAFRGIAERMRRELD